MDTRELFSRPGIPLKVGKPSVGLSRRQFTPASRSASQVPGVFDSAPDTPLLNDPMASAAPKSKLSLVQTTQPAAPKPVAPPMPTQGTDGTAVADVDDPSGLQPAPLPTAPNSPAFPALRPSQVPATAAKPPPPQQTERANPLVGDSSDVPVGASVPVAPPGQALGFSSRGSARPSGQDAVPEASTQDKIREAQDQVQGDLAGTQHVGGVGLFKRTFSNPRSASLYHSFTRDLFGDATVPNQV